MKDSVDLTEGNDFRKLNQNNNLRKYPHYFSNVVDGIKYDSNYISKICEAKEYLEDKGLVYQGNRDERLSKKLEATFCDRVTCDRCGAFIFPYRSDTLCDYCREDMEYHFQQEAILGNLFFT